MGLALTSLNLYQFAVIGRTFETEAIFVWSIYLIFSWTLFDLRRWRFYTVDPKCDGRAKNDADYAELISAVGLASSLIALAVMFYVRQLIE